MIRNVPKTETTSTRNACKLCAPLGASLVFRGIEGAVPFLHGSQGCATYIRRYMIGHFREPVDIASSNFTEHAAVFGGKANLHTGLMNVIRQYNPRLIGIATTCLAETIGDDMGMLLHQFRQVAKCEGIELPRLVRVSTPSYSGTHAEGFHDTVRALVEQLALTGDPGGDGETRRRINVLPGMVSPADLRYLRQVVLDFGLDPILLPDYSDTLDGQTWAEYHRMPEGGTPLGQIESMSQAEATFEFTSTAENTAGELLRDEAGVPLHRQPLPIGVEQSDRFFAELERYATTSTPTDHMAERGRLIDAYVDAHKYVHGVRVAIYGEEDLVVAMTGFAREIGMQPVLCASGAPGRRLDEQLRSQEHRGDGEPEVISGADFADIDERLEELKPELILGHSKGLKSARLLDVPLVRIGFPIHDRFGAARIMHLGYRGTQQLFDRIVNAILERRQSQSAVGWTYL